MQKRASSVASPMPFWSPPTSFQLPAPTTVPGGFSTPQAAASAAKAPAVQLPPPQLPSDIVSVSERALAAAYEALQEAAEDHPLAAMRRYGSDRPTEAGASSTAPSEKAPATQTDALDTEEEPSAVATEMSERPAETAAESSAAAAERAKTGANTTREDYPRSLPIVLSRRNSSSEVSAASDEDDNEGLGESELGSGQPGDSSIGLADDERDALQELDDDEKPSASEGGRYEPSSRRLTSTNSFTRRRSSSFNNGSLGGHPPPIRGIALCHDSDLLAADLQLGEGTRRVFQASPERFTHNRRHHVNRSVDRPACCH